jgi:hypothetical protein
MPAPRGKKVVLLPHDGNAVRIGTFAPDSNRIHEDVLSAYHRDGNDQNSLLLFDLQPIPPERPVTRATLTLWHDTSIWAGGDNGRATLVFRVTKPWVQWQVTWNSRSGYRPSEWVPWDRPGGDCAGREGGTEGSDPYARVTTDRDDRARGVFRVTIDVTPLVAEWHGGVHPNYGLLLTGEEGNGLHFRADRGANPRRYPSLTVVVGEGGR